MAALHTYILVCDGEGCFALYGHLPTDKLVWAIRRYAIKAGWVQRMGVCDNPKARPDRKTKLPAATMLDLCPVCAVK